MTTLVGKGEIDGLLWVLVLVDVAPSIEVAGIEKITAFMRSGMNGFESLHDVADAIAAYNPHRKRPANLDGLRKSVRLGDAGRWHCHRDPAFITLNSREPDRGVMERAAVAARAIRLPTLLIRGAESDVVTAEGACELLSVIPGSRTVDVADAGNMVAGDDNDVFSAAVEGLFRDLEPRG
jgi:pimeloyl-ACP methyl ester carboxylesterase